MSRRLASLLLLFGLLSNGAYAVPTVRNPNASRIQIQIECREAAEIPSEPRERPVFLAALLIASQTDVAPPRAAAFEPLYQRPPPAV